MSSRRPAWIRLLVSAVVAVAAGAAIGAGGAEWAVAATASWCAGAAFYIGSIWLSVHGMDADGTATHAKREDSSRTVVEISLVVASVASLGAVGYTLVEAGTRSTTTGRLLIGLAILAVALGWSVIHTVYTLRYADLYYSGEPGGIDFGADAPDYLDFAYFGFTIGMTYQVSDTTVKARRIRRSVLRHALLAYIFGAVIVAVTINLVATLLNA